MNIAILNGYKEITLSTKVYIVKAMVFSVVMYECESWTIKKAAAAAATAKSLQLCLTVCDPMDYIYPTRFLHPWNFPGTRVLEWVVVSF